jgi:hypothetical protein
MTEPDTTESPLQWSETVTCSTPCGEHEALSHLVELRDRLLTAVLAVGVLFLCPPFADYLLLAAPLDGAPAQQQQTAILGGTVLHPFKPHADAVRVPGHPVDSSTRCVRGAGPCHATAAGVPDSPSTLLFPGRAFAHTSWCSAGVRIFHQRRP